MGAGKESLPKKSFWKIKEIKKSSWKVLGSVFHET
jgi:hypothetical protein